MNPPGVVIDTNCVLDLWVFDDPRAQPLRHALEQGELRWLVCPPMREEFIRVLGYPAVAKRLLACGRPAVQVLAAFDQHSHAQPVPPSGPPRCQDPDDQVFIDLACAHSATLVSKDRAVLALRSALAVRQIRVIPVWSSDTERNKES